jgi:hypothetical protein
MFRNPPDFKVPRRKKTLFYSLMQDTYTFHVN